MMRTINEGSLYYLYCAEKCGRYNKAKISDGIYKDLYAYL